MRVTRTKCTGLDRQIVYYSQRFDEIIIARKTNSSIDDHPSEFSWTLEYCLESGQTKTREQWLWPEATMYYDLNTFEIYHEGLVFIGEL